ncbi:MULTISPECIES: FAD-dependent monooxygenase [unclassified Mesorhizobium]|uniref:FAD-dependent monooxygenase n=1 Tax=unclassified Mesorhizobium TaxID=325217 RepID=UPI001CCE1303|nr:MULTISPECIES: FAD-dependent monooxygenase [unclassified Mesorhizobium]MBZ9739644.1 FAD-dependent monooxygenase [Mesorhizobium sp. CO1-1-4]MBZ9805092.1 FAD-dependent monooxygenase [Mesorhizobium sp. ES1-6]
MRSSARSASQPQAVLIVGAGPTGLALALSLAKAGVALRVVDSRRVPATTSRAIGIQARTLELLDLFGLANAFVSRGLQARAGNIYAGRRQLVHLDLSPLSSRFPFILLLEQTETERLMTEALAGLGVHVERGVELMSFDQDAEGVTAYLCEPSGTPQAARFAYMIGCDGAHSITRHGLGLGFTGRTLQQNFVLADLDVDWALSDDEFHIFTSPEGLMAIFPMRHGHRLIAEVPAPSRDSASDPTLAQLRELAGQRVATAISVANVRWSSFFRLNSRLATRLQTGRIFLAGDSAHIHSPAGAQGMNTGIQDALNLGWKLALVLAGQAPTDLLKTYESERYAVERAVLRNTEVLTRIVSLRAPILRFARDLVAPRIARMDFVQTAARETISEIAVSYRRRGLHAKIRDANGLVAGDRLPDLAIEVDGNGPARRLYSELDPTRFTLLVLTSEDASSIDAEITPMLSRQIAKLVVAQLPDSGPHRSHDEWFYLVRPDAYLAVHGPRSRIAQAATWIELGFSG